VIANALPAQICQRQPFAVLLRERELGRRFDPGRVSAVQPSAKASHQMITRPEKIAAIISVHVFPGFYSCNPKSKIENPKSLHAFNSFFSSFQNRQSVPCEIFFAGSI